MKQRGIGAAAVIVIIIIIAAAGAGAYFLVLKGEEGAPGGMSEYPGSESWEIPAELLAGMEIPEEVDFAGYCVEDATIQEILNWYKDEMMGWTLENEMPATDIGGGITMGMLAYRKGDEGAGIVAVSGYPGLTGTCYILASGPWSAMEEGGGEGEGEGEGVTLSSVDFTVSGYELGELAGTLRCRTRKLQTDDPDLRMEVTGDGETTVIYNSTEAAFYMYDPSTGTWYKYTGSYASTMADTYKSFLISVAEWIELYGTSDFSFSYGGTTVSVTNITANPTLSDDLFSPPAGATVEEVSF